MVPAGAVFAFAPGTGLHGVHRRAGVTDVTDEQLASLAHMGPDELAVATLRTLAIDAVQKANSGHPGLPLGAAPMAHTLFSRHLCFDTRDAEWPDRDRFLLSAGHGSALLYGLLYLAGFGLTLDDLKAFRQWGSCTPGHPENHCTPGVEVTTGPLGQGFGNAVGMAIAEAHLAALFNRPGHTVVDHRVYALVSDGDLMEGLSHEAASLAGHLQLGKLICLYDDNHICLDGPTAMTFTEDVGQRFTAYGWHVQRVEDGNDLAAIDAALSAAEAVAEQPSLIAVRTHIGYGSPHKQDSAAAHGSPLGEEEVRLTKRALGWPEEAQFLVPEGALALYREVAARGAARRDDWLRRFAAYETAYPDLAATWRGAMAGELPAGWEVALPVWAPEKGAVATRSASGDVLNALAAVLPTLMGGSADLAGSNETLLRRCGDTPCGDFQPGEPGGRNLWFGVREHGMGAALNGLALHGGVFPYGGTFFVFSDYLRPSIRLAALSHAPVTYVFTHDSVAVGEDGPTHQPVEQLAALRAIPNLHVIRPSDANEVAQAWRAALERRDGPTALVLTRQKVAVIDRDGRGAAEGLRRGAYVLSGFSRDPDVVLMASGSEVALALEAADRLADAQIRARVVAMPCWEVFEAQDQSYRDEVLARHVTARVSIEAGVSLGWERYVGDRGVVIAIDRFGASAPGSTVLEQLGITADRVVEAARSLVK